MKMWPYNIDSLERDNTVIFYYLDVFETRFDKRSGLCLWWPFKRGDYCITVTMCYLIIGKEPVIKSQSSLRVSSTFFRWENYNGLFAIYKKKINISHISFSLTMAMYHKLFCLRGNMRTFFFIKDKSGRWLMMRPASLLKSSNLVFFVFFKLARILCNGCIAVLCPCINSESNAEKINRQFHFNSLSMK